MNPSTFASSDPEPAANGAAVAADSGSGEGFSAAERQAFYRILQSRRDIRAQFRPTPIPLPILSRILLAAHHAPSVGYMQPWSFILIRDPAVKARIHADFEQANQEAVALFPAEKRDFYARLKLEGIREAPLNLCLTCDRERAGPVVIGRTHIPAMDLFSSVCAVQNLWLAARAEGIGVGWVSILHPNRLKALLGIPEPIIPIAYLCLGEVSHFPERPELETAGWRQRLPLESLLHFERWEGCADNADAQALVRQVSHDQAVAATGSWPDSGPDRSPVFPP